MTKFTKIDKIAIKQIERLYSGAYELYNVYVEKTFGVAPIVVFEAKDGTSYSHFFDKNTGEIDSVPFCTIDPYM